MPGLYLLLGLEKLLDEDVDMFDHRWDDFNRLKKTIITDDYNLGHYFFTSEEKQNQFGKYAPRYNLIVPERTFCRNGKLYLVNKADIDELQKYIYAAGLSGESVRRYVLDDCFSREILPNIQKWAAKLTAKLTPGVKGINRQIVDLRAAILQTSGRRDVMENLLVSTLRYNHYLYCRTYEAWREVTSPTKRTITHSLCDTEVNPLTVKKVSSIHEDGSVS